MPKLILAAVAWLAGPKPARVPPHDRMHETTRSRTASRRQRASRLHDPYFDLSPLDLSRRH